MIPPSPARVGLGILPVAAALEALPDFSVDVPTDRLLRDPDEARRG